MWYTLLFDVELHILYIAQLWLMEYLSAFILGEVMQ
jgi:hypothetical protein